MRQRALAHLLGTLGLLAAARAGLAAPEPAAPEEGGAVEAAGPTGREIYERVLKNRFRSFLQRSTLHSGDRGGRVLETRLQMEFRNYRDAEGRAADGVFSKTFVQYSYPFDVRFSGYLLFHNDGRPNDQFVYLPARRLFRRVQLRGEAVYGTDFSFEDVIPREIEDATYRRLPDGLLHDLPVYVVEVDPVEPLDSEYSRFEVDVDESRYVVMRARYWDRAGVEVKELEADPGEIRDFGGIYVPMRVTMRNLRQGSFTTLHVTHLEPDADLPDSSFDPRRLQASH